MEWPCSKRAEVCGGVSGALALIALPHKKSLPSTSSPDRRREDEKKKKRKHLSAVEEEGRIPDGFLQRDLDAADSPSLFLLFPADTSGFWKKDKQAKTPSSPSPLRNLAVEREKKGRMERRKKEGSLALPQIRVLQRERSRKETNVVVSTVR